MISKRQRLSRKTFEEVFALGKRTHGSHMTLITYPHGKGRAVVVSKKVARTAVLRNRTRRRAYAVLREHAPAGAYIVLTKKGAGALSFGVFKDELVSLLERVS